MQRFSILSALLYRPGFTLHVLTLALFVIMTGDGILRSRSYAWYTDTNLAVVLILSCILAAFPGFYVLALVVRRRPPFFNYTPACFHGNLRRDRH